MVQTANRLTADSWEASEVKVCRSLYYYETLITCSAPALVSPVTEPSARRCACVCVCWAFLMPRGLDRDKGQRQIMSLLTEDMWAASSHLSLLYSNEQMTTEGTTWLVPPGIAKVKEGSDPDLCEPSHHWPPVEAVKHDSLPTEQPPKNI